MRLYLFLIISRSHALSLAGLDKRMCVWRERESKSKSARWESNLVCLRATETKPNLLFDSLLSSFSLSLLLSLSFSLSLSVLLSQVIRYVTRYFPILSLTHTHTHALSLYLSLSQVLCTAGLDTRICVWFDLSPLTPDP